MRTRQILTTGALVLFLVSVGLSPCAGDGDVAPGNDVFDAVNIPLDELLRTAAAEGKPLLLLFDAEGCGWCTVLQDQVFSRSDVRAELKKFVVAQYVEGHDAATPVSERFHVSGFPTTLVLDADGSEIDRVPGYAAPEAYLADLRRMLEGEDTLQSLLALGEQRSVAQIRALAAKLTHADPARGVSFCDKSLREMSDLADEDVAWLLLLRAEALANGESYEPAIETAERIVREYRETEAGKIASVQVILALVSVPPERALRFLLAAPRPEDPQAKDYLDNHAMILHLRAAEACMERQAEHHGEDAQLLNLLAWDCYRHGLNTKKAVAWGRSAVALSDRAPHILDTLAHVLFQDGEIDQAIELESEAVERATSEEGRWQYEEALAKFRAVKAVRDRRVASQAGASGKEEPPADR